MERSVWVGLALALALGVPAAHAAVVASGANGFVLEEETSFSGPAAAAWQRLVRPQDWWSSDHTYSGSAANLSLALEPGGCWCEKLAGGGFVRHMEVALALPGKSLRLLGGLGPLQGIGATGALTFALQEDPAGTTRVKVKYVVGGFLGEGHAKLAEGVDAVLGDQIRRYGAPAP